MLNSKEKNALLLQELLALIHYYSSLKSSSVLSTIDSVTNNNNASSSQCQQNRGDSQTDSIIDDFSDSKKRKNIFKNITNHINGINTPKHFRSPSHEIINFLNPDKGHNQHGFFDRLNSLCDNKKGNDRISYSDIRKLFYEHISESENKLKIDTKSDKSYMLNDTRSSGVSRTHSGVIRGAGVAGVAAFAYDSIASGNTDSLIDSTKALSNNISNGRFDTISSDFTSLIIGDQSHKAASSRMNSGIDNFTDGNYLDGGAKIASGFVVEAAGIMQEGVNGVSSVVNVGYSALSSMVNNSDYSYIELIQKTTFADNYAETILSEDKDNLNIESRVKDTSENTFLDPAREDQKDLSSKDDIKKEKGIFERTPSIIGEDNSSLSVNIKKPSFD